MQMSVALISRIDFVLFGENLPRKLRRKKEEFAVVWTWQGVGFLLLVSSLSRWPCDLEHGILDGCSGCIKAFEYTGKYFKTLDELIEAAQCLVPWDCL